MQSIIAIFSVFVDIFIVFNYFDCLFFFFVERKRLGFSIQSIFYSTKRWKAIKRRKTNNRYEEEQQTPR